MNGRRLAWVMGMSLAGAAHAGRPLTIDDAYPIERGTWQVEAGAGYVRDPDRHHWDFPLGLTYGVASRVEIGAGFGGQIESRLEEVGGRHTVSGLGDLSLTVKWHALDADRFLVDHALTFSIKLPTADSDRDLGTGHVDVDVTWIGSRSLSETLSVHANVGFTRVGHRDDEHIAHYGVAAIWQATDWIAPVIEVFANSPVESWRDTTIAINAGVQRTVADGLTLDAAVGTALRGDFPDLVATVGLTWVFGEKR